MNATPHPTHVHRRAPIALVALMAGASSLLVSASAVGQSEAGPCFTDQPGVLGTVDHPTEPDAVVLRMAVGGGSVPYEIAFLQENPTFTLYGNDGVMCTP